MEESTMKKHVTFVAALHIGFSIIGIFGAFALFFILRFAGSFVEDVDVANTVLHFIGIFLPFAIISVSIIGLIGGIGLMGYRKWARILVLISISCRLSEHSAGNPGGSLFHLGADAG